MKGTYECVGMYVCARGGGGKVNFRNNYDFAGQHHYSLHVMTTFFHQGQSAGALGHAVPALTSDGGNRVVAVIGACTR